MDAITAARSTRRAFNMDGTVVVQLAVESWIEREALSRILEMRARSRGFSIDLIANDRTVDDTAQIIVWDGEAPLSLMPTDTALIVLADKSATKSQATAADWRENPQGLLEKFERVMDNVSHKQASPVSRQHRRLTQRQEDVLDLLGRGHSNGQIATALGMSENTVRIHVSAIFKTLGVRNRTQAALMVRHAA
jgi:DNA-binding CsgD family transcriptional regulator